jgi:hypothetical protein
VRADTIAEAITCRLIAALDSGNVEELARVRADYVALPTCIQRWIFGHHGPSMDEVARASEDFEPITFSDAGIERRARVRAEGAPAESEVAA